MPKHRGTFLMRCWQIDELQRIELEHIQTGETFLAHSVLEAVEWACARISRIDDPLAPIVVLTTDEQRRGE